MESNFVDSFITLFTTLETVAFWSLPAPVVEDYKGSWRESGYKGMYAAYEGIRYAQPPIGDLRFKDPVPFEGMVNLEARIDCLDIKDENIVGQEDCLMLNVYSPYKPKVARPSCALPHTLFCPEEETKPLPVMIWIHGSGFQVGPSQSSVYGPQRLMGYDVVVVTMSYRLGPLGFASMERADFLGNYGLKDQELAIKWVQKNIHMFHGDDKQITLAGHGAGAAAVLHHLHGGRLENIRRGIALGGTRFSPWSLSSFGSVRKHTAALIDDLGCTSIKYRMDNNTLRCLRSVDAEKLVRTAHKHSKVFNYNVDKLQWLLHDMLQTSENVEAMFRPVVDGDIITSDPWDMKGPQRNFSLLLGLNNNEAGFIFTDLPTFLKTDRNTNAVMKSYFDELSLIDNYAQNETSYRKLINYYRNATDMERGLVNLMTDTWFLFPAVVEAQRHVGPLCAIMFFYWTDMPHMDCRTPRTGKTVVHGDELPFIFHIDRCQTDFVEYPRVAHKYTQMIADYVRGEEKRVPPFKRDHELANITDALLDPRKFEKFDKSIAHRMQLWKSFDPSQDVYLE